MNEDIDTNVTLSLDVKDIECENVESNEKSICQIDSESSSKLCSAQVVLNLAVAVKELVENSLDAGARNIDVFLKEYGSDTIEVSDDGSGVVERDFQALTLKHHTSKLRDYSDLSFVETFGFRGEALNSLCALGELSIVTRHVSTNCATRLEFDQDGQIIKKTPCARQVGTTVSIKNLFVTFPVRHKDFHRNLRKEFNKMVQILHAYCLISTGVRITCSNQPKKGSRSTVISTQASKSVSENIACIFGSKQAFGLMTLTHTKPSPEILQSLGLPEKFADADYPFTLEGLVSSCSHGAGRSAPDRQFYYVNSRPCEPPQVIKTVNEVYHVFNKKQYPFVFMNIKMEKENVDVNLTPDKRQVLLSQEKLLLALIKASLLKLYESVPSTLKVNNVPSAMQVSLSSSPQSDSNLSGIDFIKQWSRSPTGSISPASSFGSSPSTFGSPGTPKSTKKGIKRTLEIIRQDKGSRSKQHCLNNYFAHIDVQRNEVEELTDTNKQENLEIKNGFNNFHESIYYFSRSGCDLSQEETASTKSCDDTISRNVEDCSEVVSKSRALTPPMCVENGSEVNEERVAEKMFASSINTYITCEEKCAANAPDSRIPYVVSSETSVEVSCEVNYTEEDENLVIDKISDQEFITSDIGYVLEPIKWDVELNSIMEEMAAFTQVPPEPQLYEDQHSRFQAEVDPTQNNLAEQELRREITKDMFAKMTIVGQFNKGFIITLLESDLFIIDQHASDEIYNFEDLQKTTSLQNQRLVVPQKLDLTYVKECLLMENMEIFNKNGFEFIIDQAAEPTKRIKLSSIPISNNWTFGKDDVDELLFMLEDAPHIMCRPSRVRAMFASRACRKAVMIGTDLNMTEMRRIVDHMGEMDSPWNCPHGRPTMRHLVNFEIFFKNQLPKSGIKVISK